MAIYYVYLYGILEHTSSVWLGGFCVLIYCAGAVNRNVKTKPSLSFHRPLTLTSAAGGRKTSPSFSRRSFYVFKSNSSPEDVFNLNFMLIPKFGIALFVRSRQKRRSSTTPERVRLATGMCLPPDSLQYCTRKCTRIVHEVIYCSNAVYAVLGFIAGEAIFSRKCILSVRPSYPIHTETRMM